MRKTILLLCGALALTLAVYHVSSQPATPVLAQQELLRRLQTPSRMLLVDVRSPEEFARGHIPGAINVPHTDLPARLEEVRGYQEQQVVVYCERGVRAAVAERTLRRAGFLQVLHLQGDMAAWRDTALPLRTPPKTF